MTSDRPATARERAIFEAGIRVAKSYGDNAIHLHGDQLERQFQHVLSSLPPVRAQKPDEDDETSARIAAQTSELVRLVGELQAHAKRSGWEDVDEPLAAVLGWPSDAEDIEPPTVVPPVRAEEPTAPAKGSPFPLEHTRSCPWPMDDEECTCGLAWRVRLATEQQMHAAWRKRAEELERAALPPVQEPPKPDPADCPICGSSDVQRHGDYLNCGACQKLWLHRPIFATLPASFPSQGVRALVDEMREVAAKTGERTSRLRLERWAAALEGAATKATAAELRCETKGGKTYG